MTDQKKILSSDIRYECGDSAYTRGLSYYQSGMVSEMNIVEESERHVQLTSSVKGSGNNHYQQNIKVTWNDKFNNVEIFGYCSCPMHFNCKHVAAVCLKYRNDMTDMPIKTASHASSWLGWLETLNKQTSAKSPYQDFLAYTLLPASKKGEFNLDLTITREKKTGGLSKGRRTTVNNLRYGYTSNTFFQEGDEELIRLITALPSTYEGVPIINGATGYLVLTQAVKTGRLFYQSLDEPAIRNGESRDLNFEWLMQNNGDFQLVLSIEHNAILILTEPPMYLDPANGLIGPLNVHGIDFQQLQKILTIPRIPAEAAEEFSERLTLQHPELPLPPPRRIEIVELRGQKPRPLLTLFGTQFTTSNYVHAMTVGFDYAGHIFAAHPLDKNQAHSFYSKTDNASAESERHDWEVIKTEQGLLRIARDQAAESEAIQRLTHQGFRLMDWPGNTEFAMTAQTDSSDANGAVRWSAFLQNTVPELEQAGWVIEVNDSFLMKFQEVDTWNAEIDESGNDWFEMRFNINVDGQSLPLLPLIMPVLENFKAGQLPEMLSIPTGEHQYLNIPSERIKPFLDILFELFDAGTYSDQGVLTLSRFNAVALADLETHSYGLFSLSGGKALREIAKKLRDFKGIANVVPPEGLKAQLRDYQQLGLNWLQFLREYQFAGILADDMGLGKTIQTLAHIQLEKEQGRLTAPCLIIAPTSLMGNWRREAERFTPNLRVLILQGVDRKQHFHKINDFDIVLTTYPLLPRDEEALTEPDYHYLILDEAQIIKNPKAKASAIVRRINANHRLCLTGTPLENHLGELWAQFDFLMPGFLGDSAFFKRIYRTPIETHGDYEQRKRLSRRLEPFLLRRTKQEVAKELPPKTEMIRSVPLDSKQAALYESIRLTMEKKVRDAIAQKGLARSHITILDALLKLRQTCCDPRTLNLKEAQKVKQSAKLDLLMELLPELLEEGRRILVFSQFTKMIALIEAELKTRKIAYSKLTGQTKNRDEVINLFTGGTVDVFLISLKAGGVGLNLTEADTVIIYDPWWNPAVESQAADRAYRIGQDKPVFVYKLITENTVEEKILALQEKKRALASGVYQENNEQGFNLTAEDLTALFDPVQS
ncbi:MAG TPA: helicase SNF2 [Methylococcaceae bacterium]|nr:helicase SNF2 [Methylococcaceae bacterium]